MPELFADTALTAEGWAQDVLIRWDRQGTIESVETGARPEDAQRAPGPVVPGMVDLHSHAFQRAMAGRAEARAPGAAGDDSFWTWRETMYGLALAIEPEDADAVAAQLAVECLKRGYTGLCEFHYVHRDRDGGAYDDPATMSRAVIAGLRRTGIAVTHLPVLYARGGFGDAPLGERQRRFAGDPAQMLEIVSRLRGDAEEDPDLAVGLAPHSLRAAPPEILTEAVEGLRAMAPDAPIHIHIAEQRKEVADCEAAHGARPVALLADTVALDPHWCLVHATHLDAAEVATIARSGAVAGLCPTTEANLGDGLFPLEAYLAGDGRLGIGSDSHVSRDPARELALLEYGVRLTAERRIRAADAESPSVGGTLWRRAAAGGAQAAGRAAGAIAPGLKADLVALDRGHPDIAERTGDAILDGWLFAADETPVADVYVSGRRVVAAGHHAAEPETLSSYRKALRRLFAAI